MQSKAVLRHNHGTQECAMRFAKKMQEHPSPLEKRMIEFLNRYGISYIFQKNFLYNK